MGTYYIALTVIIGLNLLLLLYLILKGDERNIHLDDNEDEILKKKL